ncbi:N-hydroxyarylamine O-acetyltransferase [Glycomyces sambucus]|uniref:N-hydroxyarylamine O-acetyltransferase n=1 Tax=Glycomyces sambucus TaxID=380244 RepID=A0A1G9FVD6_9ACTN|nr:arylamine N-acetyltransferase [Glycomyces sambucus]SDK92305.1 N-hydroxyarylamine O-acetyltransferase [Glycomyces sambucus]
MNDETPADAWGTGDFDVDAYAERIGYRGPLRPDLATFRALQRHHVANVPFENLSVILGRGPSAALDDVARKIVRSTRGGYCFEMNVLFAAALERIGIPVRRRLMRTGDPLVNPRPRSHLVVLAELDGRTWLGDAGYGSGPGEPVPVDRAGEYRQGAWTYRVTEPAADGDRRLQERREGEWRTMYTLIGDATYPVDVAVANESTSTSPTSPFVQRPIVVKRGPEVERRLVGRTLTETGPDGVRSEREIADDRYAAVLAEVFGIELSEEEAKTVVAGIPDEPAAA